MINIFLVLLLYLTLNYTFAADDSNVVAEYCIFQKSDDVGASEGVNADTLKSVDLCKIRNKKIIELKLLRSVKPMPIPNLSKEQLLLRKWSKITSITMRMEKNDLLKYSTSAMVYKPLDNSKRLDLRFYFEDIYPWEAYPMSDNFLF